MATKGQPVPEVPSDCLQTKVMTQLAFKGQCREAFELYERVLGGKITVMNTFGGSDPRLPPGSTASAPDQIRFAELEVGGYAILGNDVPAQDYKPAQGFNIALHVNTAAEARLIFNAHSDCGSVATPLSEVAWSSAFGIVSDRFGVPWPILALDK
jgi:PhnB protein